MRQNLENAVYLKQFPPIPAILRLATYNNKPRYSSVLFFCWRNMKRKPHLEWFESEIGESLKAIRGVTIFFFPPVGTGGGNIGWFGKGPEKLRPFRLLPHRGDSYSKLQNNLGYRLSTWSCGVLAEKKEISKTWTESFQPKKLGKFWESSTPVSCRRYCTFMFFHARLKTIHGAPWKQGNRRHWKISPNMRTAWVGGMKDAILPLLLGTVIMILSMQMKIETSTQRGFQHKT